MSRYLKPELLFNLHFLDGQFSELLPDRKDGLTLSSVNIPAGIELWIEIFLIRRAAVWRAIKTPLVDHIYFFSAAATVRSAAAAFSTVASISAWLWARLINQASNCDGGSKTPDSSMTLKKWVNALVLQRLAWL